MQAEDAYNVMLSEMLYNTGIKPCAGEVKCEEVHRKFM